MIASLYPIFQRWTKTGSLYIISDPHLDDADCKIMAANWPDARTYINNLRKQVLPSDTLVCLGDVGDPKYFEDLRCYKVLITGNHDRGAKYYEPYFDEIYTGPVFISDRILLSHEPIPGLDFCINIHGHDHNGIEKHGTHYLNLAANVVDYKAINLGNLIKLGVLSNIPTIHRITTDNQIEKKAKRLAE